MYLPNQLGPYMLGHVDQAPQITGLPATSVVAAGTYSPVLSDATLRKFTASQQWGGNSFVITTGAQSAIGVALDGTNPQGDLEDINAMAIAYQVSGTLRVVDQSHTSLLEMNLSAVVGRANAATLTTITGVNACTNFISLPLIYNRSSKDEASASINTVVIIGNLNAGITYTGFPLIFGWVMLNAAGHSVTVEMFGSISAMKVTMPQHVFNVRSN